MKHKFGHHWPGNHFSKHIICIEQKVTHENLLKSNLIIV